MRIEPVLTFIFVNFVGIAYFVCLICWKSNLHVANGSTFWIIRWFERFIESGRIMGSSEMDKPAKDKEKDSKTPPPSTQVQFCTLRWILSWCLNYLVTYSFIHCFVSCRSNLRLLALVQLILIGRGFRF